MLINNSNTLSPYKEGDVFLYQGKTYNITIKIFKINSISNMEKQIVLDLVDNTGSHYSANFWKSDYGRNPNIYLDNGEYKLVEIHEGDSVEMCGFEYMYGQYKQFNPVGGYKLYEEKIEYTAPINSVKLIEDIKSMISSIGDNKLQKTCYDALNRYFSDFVMTPAATKHHHNYAGGLLHHTYEVMKIAYNISNIFEVKTDHLIVGSFFHDIMKIKEYDIHGKWNKYGDMIGHVSGSAMVFKEIAENNECNEDDINAIVHIILSHHGKKEWGSPVEPNTVEAVIVHEADMISSYINPFYINGEFIVPAPKKDYYIK